MPSEHGSAQPDGLRREHLVAAALVTAVTIVLGYASGFGVVQAGAAVGPSGPGTVATAPPGTASAAPPSAGPAAAGPARAGGSQVGIRPGSQVRGGSTSGSSAAGNSAAGNSVAGGVRPGTGSVPAGRPGAGAGPAGVGPAAPPGSPVDGTEQCQPGILGVVLGLVTQVLGGTEPATALSEAGAVTPTPAQPRADGPAAESPAAALPPTTFLPVGDGAVPVTGLVPLLQAVAERRDALAASSTPLGVLQPATASAAPVADDADPATPDVQLGQLAALLAPLGLQLDLANGTSDPLLAPVLGSLGCPAGEPALAPADPQAAAQGGAR